MGEPILTLMDPPANGVQLDSPNGVYLFRGVDRNAGKAQLVIKGPMLWNPGWYECSVLAATGRYMQLCNCEFIPPASYMDAEEQLDVLRVGFVSLTFEEVEPPQPRSSRL